MEEDKEEYGWRSPDGRKPRDQDLEQHAKGSGVE
jgi:hypothetical protein